MSSFYRKQLYDAACTTMLQNIYRLIAKNDQGFKYGDIPGEDDNPTDFDVDNATNINDDSDWPKLSSDDKVVFLDPEAYGGSEERPPFHVLPLIKNGWMALMDVVFPDPNACAPEDENILGTKNIISRANDSYNILDDDPRLFLDPDCDNETPFAKIHSRESAAGIEALIYANCRAFMADHALRTMPAFSKVNPSFEENNIDELYFEYVAAAMQNEMEELSTSFGKRRFEIDGVYYPIFWLLFLEQCVQLFVRKRNEGEISPTEEHESAIEVCQEAQNSFEFPKDDAIKEEMKALRNLILGVAGVGALAPYGIVAGGPLLLLFLPLLRRKARNKLILERKLKKIQEVEDSCVVILKYFLAQEAAYIGTYLNEKLSQNAFFNSETQSDGGYINNLHEYFIKKSDFMVRAADEKPINVPKWDGTTLSNPLKDDPDAILPGSSGEYSINYLEGFGSENLQILSTIFEKGVFVFEKYVKITPKDGANFSNVQTGIVNLETFHSDMVGKFATNFLNIDATTAADTNISDYFGDLSVETDEETGEETLSGDSNGIGYGIRISYIPPYNTNMLTALSEFKSQNASNIDAISQLLSGIYLDNPADYGGTTYDNTSYLFPLVSIELDLPDMTISELDVLTSDDFDTRTDDNGVAYYDCLLSKLLNSEEYRLMFMKLVSIPRLFSFLSTHVDASFVYSIGSTEDSFYVINRYGLFSFFRETIQDWEKDMLPKTKKFLSKMFMYQYNVMDELYEDGNDQTERNSRFKELLSGIKMGFNMNLKWWLRRRQVPDVCEDDLGDLFED